MLDDMKKYVRAGLEALSSPGAEDAAGAFVDKAGGLAEQFGAFASGFLEWSAEARASLVQELKDVITRQVESMGLATKEDVETLRRRLDRLEAGAGAKGSASPGHKAGAKRSAPRARKAGAKGSASPGRKAGAKGSASPGRKAGAKSASRKAATPAKRASRPPASE